MITTQSGEQAAEARRRRGARGRPSGGRRWRPASGETAAKTAARKASASSALPRLAVIRGRELRRALGDQGVAFADEGAVLDFAGEDDLAAAAEGVGDGAACR